MFLRNKSLLFFVDGLQKNPSNRIFIQKGLKNENIYVFQTTNSMSLRAIQQSIINISFQFLLSSGVSYLLTIDNESSLIKKSELIAYLKTYFFTILSFKLNSTFYNTNSINDAISILDSSNSVLRSEPFLCCIRVSK